MKTDNWSHKNLFGLALAILLLSPAINAAGPATVDLGSSGSFVVLAKSGISTTGTTSIVGDIGVSPIDSTAITGFGLILDSSNQFATSSLLNGKAYAANYAVPTPAKMTTAVSDMQTAYTDAAGRTNPTATELGAGNIGGLTIAPGLYKWGTGVTIPAGVTLSGGSNDVWIFQIAQNLNVGNGAIVTLGGGAQAQNIFWQVAGQATLGTTSDFKGVILSQTAIVINTGAKLNGRALAQTAVTLDADSVTAPTGTTPTPTPAPSQNPPESSGSSGPTGPAGSPGPIGTDYTGSYTAQTPAPIVNTDCYWDSNLGYSRCPATPTAVNQPPTSAPTPSTTPSPTSQPTASQPAPKPSPIVRPAASATPPTPTPSATSAAPASTASIGGPTMPWAGLQAFIAIAIFVILATGLYYYLVVMKK